MIERLMKEERWRTGTPATDGYWTVDYERCLSLLSHVSKHRPTLGNKRGEWQTVLGLSDELGIPRTTLRHILEDAKERPDGCLLFKVAQDHGYSYRLMDENGSIIDVESRGYCGIASQVERA
jgi:hypothetical protein